MRHRNRNDEDDDFDDLFGDLFEDRKTDPPGLTRTRGPGKLMVLIFICFVAALAVALAISGVRKF